MFFVLYPAFFRSGQNHNFILCSIFFIVQKCHVFIEYDIFSWFTLWGIFYIFLVYFYSEILLMLSRHTFYFISPLPNKKSIKNNQKSFGKLFGNLPIFQLNLTLHPTKNNPHSLKIHPSTPSNSQ